MNPVINELIALDREAQKMVSDAQQQRETLRLQIHQEKQDLHQRYLTEYEAVLTKRKEQIRQEHEAIMACMEQEYSEKTDHLSALFRDKEEQWTKEMVQNCTRL